MNIEELMQLKSISVEYLNNSIFNRAYQKRKVFRFILKVFILFTLNGCSDPGTSPILVLATDTDFGSYTGEILKAEGFNAFRMIPASDQKISLRYLQHFDLVILADSKITSRTSEIIQNYVEKGGNLIAFRSHPDLDTLFGIRKWEDGFVVDGYIGIDTAVAQGKGLSEMTLQYHGHADKYRISGGKVIAGLYAGPNEDTGYPAVISNLYGKGQATVFAYNLPESIVYTRQGDPLKAGQETDSIPGIRAMDMFTGNWVNTSRNRINQADEQMRLLSHCIESMASSTKPLPKFWYFPDQLQCLVTLTNDGEYREEPDFEVQLSDLDSMGAKMSLYILETDLVTRSWVNKWTNRGFEISGHPDDTEEAADPQWDNMHEQLLVKREEIQQLFGLPMRTVVNHWFVWCGKDSVGNPEFAAQAELESKIGIEMDVNYAHYDNNSSQGHFLGRLGLDQGNYTGSGLVMKFAGSNGKILSVYQHLNNVYDQQYMENDDPDGFFNCFKGLVDRSLDEEAYSFISIKAHNDEYHFSKQPLIKMLEYAAQKNIPVWTVSNLLDFIKMKDEASFSDINWSGNRLNFRIDSNLACGGGLTFLLPASYHELMIKNILVNGSPGRFITREIKGYGYALVTVEPGSRYEISAEYSPM